MVLLREPQLLLLLAVQLGLMTFHPPSLRRGKVLCELDYV